MRPILVGVCARPEIKSNSAQKQATPKQPTDNAAYRRTQVREPVSNHRTDTERLEFFWAAELVATNFAMRWICSWITRSNKPAPWVFSIMHAICPASIVLHSHSPSTNISRRSNAFPRSFSASAYELEPYHSRARCIEGSSTMTILRVVGDPSTTCASAPRAR